MADGFIIVPPDSTGKKMDTTELTVGANVVERERVNIADGVAAAQIATVTAASALKVDGSAVTQPVSGTVTSNQGAPPWSQRVQDGVGATLATVTAANALKVDGSAVTQPISGTVTANIGTSGSLALDASVAGLSLTQGAATAGQKALLAEGAVTTAAPAYTTGNSNPLSLTTAGLLRTDGSGVTQPVSGTVTSNQGGAPWSQRIQDGVGATLATVTAANAVKVDGSAVTQPVSGTVTANAGTGLADLTSTGTITALNGSVTLAIAGARGAAYLLTGVWVATVQAQISVDGGTTFIAVDSYDYSTEKVVISTTTNSTFAIADMRGASHVKVTATAFTSGTINVTIKASQASDLQNTKFDGVPASAVPNHAAMVGASDGTNLLTLRAATAAPAGTEAGLIVRNVPSGTQAVSGTVTANQGTANATPWNENIAQIAGTATSTAAAGTQKVGITGNTAAAMDAAQNAAAPANELVVGGVFNTTIPALTAGNASQLQVDSTGAQQVDLEGRKATYSAFASFTPVAGDIAVLPGSGTKTIRVFRVEVSLSTSGTAAIGAVQLVKRSTADTAGTSAAMTAVPHDSNFAAATAAPLSYTVAPTLGTAVGTIRGVQFSDASSALPGANTWIWTFGDGRGGAASIVLRGTAQELCVNLGAVVATQTATVSFEWTEE